MRLRLSLLFFLQFAVWGCYLVSLGQYLGSVGIGPQIQWFYAVGGFAALFMPTAAGAVADRHVAPQRLLGALHAAAALMMGATFAYGYSCGESPEFAPLFILFTLATLFYIPTLSLSISASMALLRRDAIDPGRAFPAIRVWGTVGFVIAMWVVNSVWVVPGEGVGITLSDSDPHAMQRLQYTVGQLGASSALEAVLAIYAFALPRTPVARMRSEGMLRSIVGSLKLLGNKQMMPFFLFSMLIGVALQVNNGYVAPYLTHFRGMPEFAATFGANNATLLSSLSQISEALWILPVGAILAGIGIKRTVLIAILAWVVNFGCFALGNPGSGLWLIIGAMIVYGVAFDFFNIAGAIYIDRCAPAESRQAAQGLMMMMTKGIGSSVGMLAAGAIVNHYCQWTVADGQRYLMGSWPSAWLIFTAYCALVALLFWLFFKSPSPKNVR